MLSAGMGFLSQMLLAALKVNWVELLEFQLQWAKDCLPHDGVQAAHILAPPELVCRGGVGSPARPAGR